MADVTAGYEATLLKSTRNGVVWDEAALDAWMAFPAALPSGCRITAAQLTVRVTQDPIVGSYFTAAGERLRTSVGVKTVDVSALIAPGSSGVTIPVRFSGTGQTYTNAQLVVALELSVTYVLTADTLTSLPERIVPGEAFAAGYTDNGGYTHQLVVAMGTHQLGYPYTGGASGVAPAGSSTIYGMVPAEWLDVLPSASSGTVALVLYTLDGGTVLGTDARYVPLVVTGAAFEPSFVTACTPLALAEVSYPDSCADVYVRGRCGVTAALTVPAAKYGAAIVSTAVWVAGSSWRADGAGAVTLRSGVLPAQETVQVVFSATDSRGLTHTEVVALATLAYQVPQITAMGVCRADAQGHEDESGAYGLYYAAFFRTSLGGRNELLAREMWVRAADEMEFALISTDVQSGEWAKVSVGGVPMELTLTKRYVLRLILTDRFGSVHMDAELSSADFPLYIRPSGDGFGLGCACEQAKSLQLAPDWELYYKGRTMGAQLGGKAELAVLWTGELAGTGSVTLGQSAAGYALLVVCNGNGQAMVMPSGGGSLSARNLWFDGGGALHVVDSIYSVGVAGDQMAVSASGQFVDGAYSQAAAGLTAVYGIK